jgi:ABC-2 type transport system ATP-binding protein
MELLGISERGHDEVRKYSGGMMRRLEIGTAIVHNPFLIVLDEPAIGLDPQGRRTVWELLKRLVHEYGTTIFMTTHDMSEADELCDRIAIVNHGKIAVIGTPSNLKHSVEEEDERVGAEGGRGNNVIIKTLTNPLTAISVLESELGIKAKIVVDQQQQYLCLVLKDTKSTFSELLSTLVNAGIKVGSIDVQKPTLDDVFLKYAGTSIH